MSGLSSDKPNDNNGVGDVFEIKAVGPLIVRLRSSSSLTPCALRRTRFLRPSTLDRVGTNHVA